MYSKNFTFMIFKGQRVWAYLNSPALQVVKLCGYWHVRYKRELTVLIPLKGLKEFWNSFPVSDIIERLKYWTLSLDVIQ